MGRGRFSTVEASLLGAVFVVAMLSYWTLDTMIDGDRVSRAAESMRAMAAGEPDPEPDHPWGPPRLEGEGRRRTVVLCPPSSDLATALALSVDSDPPGPGSTCVQLPVPP